jgi:hypothetical protein
VLASAAPANIASALAEYLSHDAFWVTALSYEVTMPTMIAGYSVVWTKRSTGANRNCFLTSTEMRSPLYQALTKKLIQRSLKEAYEPHLAKV